MNSEHTEPGGSSPLEKVASQTDENATNVPPMDKKVIHYPDVLKPLGSRQVSMNY